MAQADRSFARWHVCRATIFATASRRSVNASGSAAVSSANIASSSLAAAIDFSSSTTSNCLTRANMHNDVARLGR